MYQEISVRMCKRYGKMKLAAYQLRLPLFLLFTVIVFSFLGITYCVYDLCLWLFGSRCASALTVAISLLGTVFLLAPLWRGLNAYPIYVFASEVRDISKLFFFFSHKRRYFYAVRRAVGDTLRVVFFLGLFSAICALGRSVSADLLRVGRNSTALLVLLLSIFFAILLAVTFMRWQADLFLLDYIFLSAPLLTYRQARILSERRMRYGIRALRCLNFSFLPLWGISLLCFGIPLVIFVPYYLAVRANLSERLMKI